MRDTETVEELRARLRALRAEGAIQTFAGALVNAWPTIDALLARLATAEEDADRLAEELRDTKGYVGEYFWEKWDYDETLRLHDEAVAEAYELSNPECL